MAADTDIIREFLVSLGFQIDQSGLKKFVNGLDTTNRGAIAAGKSVIGVGLAAQAMVATFANSMEKLYYSSRRTGASVDNILALDSGFRRIGLSAGSAQEALEGMAAAVRMNPGMRSLMDGLLGKDSSKMDQGAAMLELVQKLSSMPHFQGAQFAQMFGIDEKTFLMLKDGMPELVAAEERHLALLKAAGVDGQTAAESAKEYANSLRDLGDKVSVLGKKLSVELLPYFRELNKGANHVLDSALQLKPEDFNAKNAKGFAAETWGNFKAWLKKSTDDRQKEYEASWRSHGATPQLPGPAVKPALPAPVAPRASAGTGALFANLESKYHLPPGLLDRVWAKESGRGKYMHSPAGAEGHFGFMPPTARQYGLADPNNLEQSADAAARKYADLLRKYKGSLPMAAAAYNWGDGNLDKKGMARAPFETRDYVASIAGAQAGKQITINQKTDIHVNGADSPQATGRAIGQVQDQVTGTMVRNMRGAVS